MTPTVGRIVHYNSCTETTGDVLAALVVAVHGPTCVTLQVWDRYGGCRLRESVELGTNDNTWRWPERVA